MIDQPGNDAGLVVDLVQVPKLAADVAIRDLPDQRQHRRVHRIRGQQCRACVEQARPRHHRESLRLAGRERGAQRHVSRALLVARVDGADAILRLEQRIEQMIVLHAGQRVDRVEPMRDEARNDRLGRGHLRHGAARRRSWQIAMSAVEAVAQRETKIEHARRGDLIFLTRVGLSGVL